VVTGTNRNALLVEQGADIRRVRAIQQEAEYAGFLRCGTDFTDTTKLISQFIGTGKQGIFMLPP